MITRHDIQDRCPRPRRYALSLRRGVTLIELMFSIGILLVGLLGVAALIPLAGWEIGRGLTADRMAAAGRNAVHEFDIRNMRRPEMWANYDHSQFILGDNELSFCIDPLGRKLDKLRFPSPAAGASMRRISLFERPGSSRPMDQGLAERIFMARDDLAVDRPDDPTLPPQHPPGTATRQRPYNGSFSWFATLVRQVPGSEEFVLSIVVLEDRDLRAGDIDTSLDAEQELNVSILSRVSGGEIQVPGQPDITTGDWLMLAASPVPPITISGLFRWYRVVNSSQDLGSTYVTLEGADIDFDPTTAVLVPGVVGVLEKTIRIEGTSMWDTTP